MAICAPIMEYTINPKASNTKKMVAVSIRRDGKVVGRNVKNQQTVSQKADPMVVLDDGSALLNTSELGKDIVGYGGNVPLEITLREGRVENIRALANSETPDFFRLASALLTKWNGQTIEDAQKIGVDSAGHHAGHGIRLSAFWQEIILLHACVSLRFFAGTCREVRRI